MVNRRRLSVKICGNLHAEQTLIVNSATYTIMAYRGAQSFDTSKTIEVGSFGKGHGHKKVHNIWNFTRISRLHFEKQGPVFGCRARKFSRKDKECITSIMTPLRKVVCCSSGVITSSRPAMTLQGARPESREKLRTQGISENSEVKTESSKSVVLASKFSDLAC